MNKYTTRKKKKMKLEMDGQFPVLPCAPAATHEKTELLQLMIREFIAVHYQLACGKETSTTPWRAIAKNQSSLWDSEMWPSGVLIQDPSKIVLSDCLKIVTLWRGRQTQGGPSHTFRFNFYINSDGLQPAIYPAFVPTVLPVGLTPPPESFTPPTNDVSSQMAETISRTVTTDTHISSTVPLLHAAELGGNEMHTVDERRRRTEGATPQVDATLQDARPPEDAEVQRDVHSPDQPESDPPIANGKGRKSTLNPFTSEDEFSDVSTNPGGHKSRMKKSLRLQRSLANLSPEPPYDNEESLPPRLGNKAGRKVARKARTRRNAPAALTNGDVHAGGVTPADTANRDNDPTGISGQSPEIHPAQLEEGNDDNGSKSVAADDESRVNPSEGPGNSRYTAGEADEHVIRSKVKPKPRPLKKKPTSSDPLGEETLAEQREREDNLFIVRKSGRMPKPKYNIAPPAQLRLEKEREANKNRK